MAVFNDFVNDAEIQEHEASEVPEVRRLASHYRELGKEALRYRMELLGRFHNQGTLTPDISVGFWTALIEGAEALTDDEVTELEQLSQIAGGWWDYSNVSDPVFVPKDEWLDRYDELTGQ